MKKLSLLFAVAAGATLLYSCEEKPIVIPKLDVGDRKILVEELTGVRCQNCPAGTAELNDVGSTLGDNLIVVALHTAAGYDVPFSDSRYDFRTPECKAIADYLFINGDPGAPVASVDRQFLDDFSGMFIYRPWKGTINTRASVEPELGIFINPTFNAATRTADITVNVSPDKLVSGEIRLSVYITEDSIVDIQQKGSERVMDYVHRHVFRDAVSAPTGDNITALLETGNAFSKTYTVTLPPEWKAQHCSVVAFVHRHNEDPKKRQILQADEKHLY